MATTTCAPVRKAFRLALVAGALALLPCDLALAQKKEATTSKADKGVATKKGVAGSLGSKEIDAEKLPGKLEMGIAFGSVAGMIAAFKYL